MTVRVAYSHAPTRPKQLTTAVNLISPALCIDRSYHGQVAKFARVHNLESLLLGRTLNESYRVRRRKPFDRHLSKRDSLRWVVTMALVSIDRT